MLHSHLRTTVWAVPAAVLALAASAGAAASVRQPSPAVLHVGQIDRQDVPTQAGCEKDTLVEPSVAVSPFNSNIAVAAAHDCRFSNGGAVDISYAWTHDGGATWHHAPLPHLTKAVGGQWDRASDPVVAFGADGSVYIAALVLDLTCPGGVTISKSTDGGMTFGPPVIVHESRSCRYSDDKDWLVVDTQRTSPFYGRLYVFWTPFVFNASGQLIGNPQVVRWSDDGGATWSPTHSVTQFAVSTQDSQPMIQPDGSITDAYLLYRSFTSATAAFVARTSHDGGASWGPASTIVQTVGNGPNDVRCCLPAAAADPVNGDMYATWEANAPGETVLVARSTDGAHWTTVAATHTGATANIEHVNVAVAAYGGDVFVSYGTRDMTVASGRYVQQQVSASYDAGATYGPPVSLGPLSDLRYAAVAGAAFPGDYIGVSATGSLVDTVWCVSSTPPQAGAAYHQVMYSASLRP